MHMSNNPEQGLVENPSHSGFGPASAMAKFYGILANGGQHKNKRLISAEGVEKLKDVMTSGEDKVLFLNITYGRGTTLFSTPTVSVSLFFFQLANILLD